MSSIATISLYIVSAVIIFMAVFMSAFHLWSIFTTTKEMITDVRKQFFLRYLLALVIFVILFACLWLYGHHLI
jgi:hypothetical protein